MYVCICRGFTVDDITAHIHAGARSLNQIGRRCGAGGDCGACVQKIKTILQTTPHDDGTMELQIAG